MHRLRFLMFALLACGEGACMAMTRADGLADHLQCQPPDFLSDGQCWTELADGEDCRVEPIVMDLEDQPVYCPRNSILPARTETGT